MSDMPMMSPATAALMTTAMMVAMMLPSIAPVLWRHHRHLRAMGAARAGERTTIFATGYATVWTFASVGLFALSAEVSPMGMASMGPSLSPLTVGVVLLCAGAVQRSRWKARQLVRCGDTLDMATVAAAWREGCRFGVRCCLSCAAPMAVLFIAGLMDTRAMFAITLAITAERIAPAGQRLAGATGSLAFIAGATICVHAIAGMAFGAA
jgi:predicted metal-binding membrane protein